MSIKGIFWNIMVLALFLFFAIGGSFCFAAKVDEVEMDVTGGYNGISVADSYNPFDITLHNMSRKDFSGELQIVDGIEPRGNCIFYEPVNIAKGATKVYKISAFIGSGKRVRITLVSGLETVKSMEYLIARLIPQDSMLFGVMCDDTGGLDPLKGISLPGIGESVEFINLNAANFPEDYRLLEAFRFILLTNFDTTELSGQQTAALKKWVSDGGVLLMGTGSSWSKVYSGLPDALIPFFVRGSLSLDSSKMPGEYCGVESELPGLNIVTGDAGTGTVLTGEDGMPLALNYKMGGGSITLMTFDPSVEPIASWKGIQSLIVKFADASYTILKNLPDSPTPVQMLSFSGYAGSIPKLTVPSLGVLFLVIFFYMVIVGPCTYYLLKWGKKSHLNWYLIPLTALLFTFIVYGAGIKTRAASAMLNSVSLIKIDNASATAHLDMYAGAFSSREGSMRLSSASSADLRPVQASALIADMGYVKSNTLSARLRPVQGVSYKLSGTSEAACEIFNVRKWEPKFFRITDTISLKTPLLDSVSFHGGKFSAVVRNPMPFDLVESYIVYGNEIVPTGSILRGQIKNMTVWLDDRSEITDLESFLRSSAPERRELLKDFCLAVLEPRKPDGLFTFFALNSDYTDRFLKINGKTPVNFNENIVYSCLKAGE